MKITGYREYPLHDETYRGDPRVSVYISPESSTPPHSYVMSLSSPKGNSLNLHFYTITQYCNIYYNLCERLFRKLW